MQHDWSDGTRYFILCIPEQWYAQILTSGARLAVLVVNVCSVCACCTVLPSSLVNMAKQPTHRLVHTSALRSQDLELEQRATLTRKSRVQCWALECSNALGLDLPLSVFRLKP